MTTEQIRQVLEVAEAAVKARRSGNFDVLIQLERKLATNDRCDGGDVAERMIEQVRDLAIFALRREIELADAYSRLDLMSEHRDYANEQILDLQGRLKYCQQRCAVLESERRVQ